MNIERRGSKKEKNGNKEKREKGIGKCYIKKEQQDKSQELK